MGWSSAAKNGWWRVRAALVLLGVMAAACGGSDAASPDATEAAPTSTNPGVTITADDGNVVLATSDRPDWLPVWLLLPEGLRISVSLNTPATGVSSVTGTIEGADADKLYNDAVFMAQSGGYIITEEIQAGSRGFIAEHTGDGSTMQFSLVMIEDGLHQWSMNFQGIDGGDGSVAQPAPGAGDVGLEPLLRRGNLTLTATSPRVFTRIDGACDANDSLVQFLSDDESTRFMVFTGDATGSAGEVTADVEGDQLTWVAADESDTSTAQTDRNGAYYEGDFIQGENTVFAVVQITCNE